MIWVLVSSYVLFVFVALVLFRRDSVLSERIVKLENKTGIERSHQ